jgi:hypothetical protein
MIQVERYTDECGILSIIDNEGYTYLMKIEQELLEDTNRANKPKTLISLDTSFKVTEVNMVNLKDKDCKCILIGRNSTSQISVQNIRTSDMDKIPKKVPVGALGIITYKI